MSESARFVVSEARRTEPPSALFAAVMSIDSLQFMDPGAATSEIARLLSPGGTAVVTTWEALTEVDLPAVVHDYEPFFRDAGLAITKHETLEGARALEQAHYAALLKHAQRLRVEMRESVEPLLDEAERGLRKAQDPPRVRKVLIVARKTRSDASRPNAERSSSESPTTTPRKALA
jgi:hypothetical protein